MPDALTRSMPLDVMAPTTGASCTSIPLLPQSVIRFASTWLTAAPAESMIPHPPLWEMPFPAIVPTSERIQSPCQGVCEMVLPLRWVTRPDLSTTMPYPEPMTVLPRTSSTAAASQTSTPDQPQLVVTLPVTSPTTAFSRTAMLRSVVSLIMLPRMVPTVVPAAKTSMPIGAQCEIVLPVTSPMVAPLAASTPMRALSRMVLLATEPTSARHTNTPSIELSEI